MMILKVTKKKALYSLQTVYFWNLFIALMCGVFLNEPSILVFAELAIFQSISVRASLEKIVRNITR